MTTGSRPPTLFISAGEPSGDLHGAGLARALRTRIPGVRLIGLGGPLMAAEGVELLAGLDDLAVMGFAEVLSRLPFFLKLRRRVFQSLADEAVDLVIPIDYPGFNLRLMRHSHRSGIATLLYIAPQVWAWHASRTRQIAEDADRIAVILPFEEQFLRNNGANAEFVGHPLLDPDVASHFDEAEWRADEGLSPDSPVLALFPGSRKQEVERHLAVFQDAADRLVREVPRLQVRIAAAGHLPDEVFASARYATTSRTGQLLKAATAAIVKSGTTTLEAALAATPFVVAYRMNPLSFALAKRLVDVPHIALANLVADERVVPELIQDDANPANLASAVLPLLDVENPERKMMLDGLARIRERLGGGGAAGRVAEIAAELLGVAAA